ncbi:MAG TPA: bifunctional DNA-formamidopyrimidine glycosylase/DNA-(apurinic or apyrimidinic site) lyase [Tepidisphaeraceae bacterium]|nr:bifunctional DNA-formamidopyrimidine glycosylase/DNA-(apurinic or apyrimidinic site) lyase [Tepidisphaeraceae bacterium]
MPELPEVQTVVNTLSPRLTGGTFRRIAHVRGDIVRPCGFDLPEALTGRTVTSITRRGKRIIIALDDGNALYFHLGMTGQMTISHSEAPIEPHTHLIADLASKDQLRFRDPRRFGGIFWLGREQSRDDRMGPEPLAMSSTQLGKNLSRTKRAVKNALMDQRVVAGLGNIYVDESLFAARIHPLRRADRLNVHEIARLTSSIKLTLKRAIRHRGSSLRDYVDADGERGGFQNLHRVYARQGRPCATCATPIKRIVLGGRSTHWCPTCQRRTR